MTDSPNNKPHISFWLIGTLALIWNLLGAINFIVQMNPDMVAAMSEEHKVLINGRPLWGTIAFAIAVFGGALGCILLLLRKALALIVFVVSLLGVMIQLAPSFKLAGEINMTPSSIFMMMVMPLIISAFLAWYTLQTQSKGWIK